MVSYSGFSFHPLRCLELDFCSSFSKVGLNLGRIVYLCIFLYFVVRIAPASLSLLSPSPPPFFVFYVNYVLHHAPYVAPFSLSRQSVSCPSPSASLPASNWHKLSELIVCFSVFMLYFLETFHVLSCFVLLKSVLFNLLCVLGIGHSRRNLFGCSSLPECL